MNDITPVDRSSFSVWKHNDPSVLKAKEEFEQIQRVLPGVAQREESLWSTPGTNFRQTRWNRFKHAFTTRKGFIDLITLPTKDTEAKKTQASLAYNISKEYDLPLIEAYNDFEHVTRDIGIRQTPTNTEMISFLFNSGVTGAFAVSPLATILGLAEFTALTEVESFALSSFTDREYKWGEHVGLVDLIDPSTSDGFSSVVELFDVALKGGIIGKFNTKLGEPLAKKFERKFLQEMIKVYKYPEKVFIESSKLREAFYADDVALAGETMAILTELNMTPGQFRKALKYDVTVEMPAETLIYFIDKPVWGKIKGFFRDTPVEPRPTVIQPDQVKKQGKPRLSAIVTKRNVYKNEKPFAQTKVESTYAGEPVVTLDGRTLREGDIVSKPVERLEVEGIDLSLVSEEAYYLNGTLHSHFRDIPVENPVEVINYTLKSRILRDHGKEAVKDFDNIYEKVKDREDASMLAYEWVSKKHNGVDITNFESVYSKTNTISPRSRFEILYNEPIELTPGSVFFPDTGVIATKRGNKVIRETFLFLMDFLEREIPVMKKVANKEFRSGERIPSDWGVAYAAEFHRPSRFYRYLAEGKENAAFEEVFYNRYWRDESRFLDHREKRETFGRNNFFTDGVTSKTLQKTVNFKGEQVTFNKLALIKALADSKDPKVLRALEIGNGITKNDLKEVDRLLPDNVKKYVKKVTDELGKQYPRLQKAVYEYDGTLMPPKRDSYVHVYRDLGNENVNMLDVIREENTYLNRVMTVKAKDELMVSKSPTKAMKGGGDHQLAINLEMGLHGTWLQTVALQERFIHTAAGIRDNQVLLSSKNEYGIQFRRAVMERFGDAPLKQLELYHNKLANNNYGRSFSKWATTSRQIRQNFSIAYLGFNFVTMAKQVPSMALFLGRANAYRMSESVLKASTIIGFDKMFSHMKEKSPQMRRRNIEIDMDEMTLTGKSTLMAFRNKYGEFALLGIKLLDRTVTTIGWDAVYRTEMARHGNEPLAIMQADKAVVETQPQSAIKDLAKVYLRDNEYANWMLRFSQQLNNIHGIFTVDIKGYIKQKEYSKAMQTIVGMGLASSFMYMISQGEAPQNASEFSKAMLEQFAASVPMLGSQFSAVSKGFSPSQPEPLEYAVKAFQLASLKSGFNEDIASNVRRNKVEQALLDDIIRMSIAGFVGYPVVMDKRVRRMLENEDLGELVPNSSKKNEKIRIR